MERKFESVIDLPDALVIARALMKYRGYILPKNLDTDTELRKRTAAEARLRLAESSYEEFKVRLKKGKKVSEEELNFIRKDIELATKAMFE